MEMQPRLLFALRCVVERWPVQLPGALAWKGGVEGEVGGRGDRWPFYSLEDLGGGYRLSSEEEKIWAYGMGPGEVGRGTFYNSRNLFG